MKLQSAPTTRVLVDLPTVALRVDRASEVSLQTRPYRQLRDTILAGHPAAGARLPSTRDLACDVSVSRNTFLEVFTLPGSEGYDEGHVGKGTFVSRELARSLLTVRDTARDQSRTKEAGLTVQTIAGVVSATDHRGTPRPFRAGTPALDPFPYRLWGRLLARRWKSTFRDLLTYAAPAGSPEPRVAISRYLSCVRCDPDRLIPTHGSQHAWTLAASLLVQGGDRVWIEDPGFLGARSALEEAGTTVISVPAYHEGLDVEAGRKPALHARLAYVTASHQYPFDQTLSLRRRLALLQWAGRTGARILEEDYDGEFRCSARSLPALQAIDTSDRAIYIGTFSKVLFPSIHTGDIIAPRQRVSKFVTAGCLTGHAAATLEHAVLCDFFGDGYSARHVRRMRVLQAQRQRALIAATSREMSDVIDTEPCEAGMHLMGSLPGDVNDSLASRAAFEAEVEVTPLSAYGVDPPRRRVLRLGYTGFAPRQRRVAARRLGASLRALYGESSCP